MKLRMFRDSRIEEGIARLQRANARHHAREAHLSARVEYLEEQLRLLGWKERAGTGQ